MRFGRKKRKPHLAATPVVELPLRHPDENLQDRGVLLHEWELLNNLPAADMSSAQIERWRILKKALWSPEESNPWSGIHRVRGGHGFSVHTGPPKGCVYSTLQETCGVCGHPEFCPTYGNRRRAS